MAYLYSQRLNPVDQSRGVVERQTDMLRRLAHEIFWSGEKCAMWLDADGCGVWIGVYGTWRPEALLREIKKQAFPSFGFLGVHFDGQIYWTHFRALVY